MRKGKMESCELTRRDFLAASAGAGVGLYVLSLGSPIAGLMGADAAEAQSSGLEIFREGYPQAFFFRQSEFKAAEGLPYSEWEEIFLPLNGIMGQALPEVRPDTVNDNNLEYFTRFKERHPEKAVFIHISGQARDPGYDREGYFAGHWLYFAGTSLTEATTAESGQTVLRVADTSVFSLERGRGYKDDIGAAVVGSDGRPDWNRAEQLKLVSIDTENSTITVERGFYGTQPIYLPEGSYVAAHVATGPFGGGNPTWVYNFATVAPRDVRGRRAIEARVEELSGQLTSGGVLSPFDGIEFDAFRHTLEGPERGGFPEADVDNDGSADAGIVGGINTFLRGLIEFEKQLRGRVSSDKLILGDAWNDISRPSYTALNGIESEGWPSLYDPEVVDWSGGLNRHAFWAQNSEEPQLNYINYKFLRVPGGRVPVDYSTFRLVFAAGMATDSALTYINEPDSEDREVGIFDELWKGVEEETNWLGMPLDPAMHLAEETADLLEGQGERWPQSFISRFEGEGVVLTRRGNPTGNGRGREPSMTIRAKGNNPNTAAEETDIIFYRVPVLPPLAVDADPVMAFTLPGVDVPGEDLFVSLKLRTEPLEDYPESIGRRVKVTATPEGSEEGIETFTWANEDSFDAVFYFRDMGPGSVDLTFQVEGEEPVVFEKMTVHSSADAMYREFENGAVFANPSNKSYTFDIEEILPGASFRRIQGTEEQDPQTNDGSPVDKKLTLGPKDGLAVVRSDR